MKKNLLFSALLLCAAMTSKAQSGDSPLNTGSNQDDSSRKHYDISTLGFGIGFDYGGFGLNYAVFPQENIGIFGGVGYAIAGAGYNVGIKLRLTPKHKFNPFVMFMYGYNAAIAVTNTNNAGGPNLNKIFYGTTAGIGFDLGVYKPKKGYISVAMTLPFRSPDVNNYIDELKTEGVVFKNSLSSVGFSIGYKFVMF